jgi:phosphoserine phosphatase|eukprot:TRINITY_DN68568_c0_g1_i1.p1 TRINITY_DN68568_c0_g1~~TRINITY_DN68568_c0_g1_i1.p1  ORF type:complete len:853 (-),score=148.92 TRINITY_DN68568_c0_g1_i1:323-2881(-)
MGFAEGGNLCAQNKIVMANAGDANHAVLVVRCWGRDRPGICQQIVKIASFHEGKVLDMSQFLLDGCLMFTFVLWTTDNSSIEMMQDLTSGAKALDMKLDFHAVGSETLNRVEAHDKMASVSVVSSSAITPALLRDLDSVFSEHGCVVLDIDHRYDNMKVNNGEYNKIHLRVACPDGLKLSTLCMGSSQTDSGLTLTLQQTVWKHGAQVSLRWWDALTRPHGKSLVVFELSDVLCPYNVLDKVLLEAGLNPHDAEIQGKTPAEVIQQKYSMLKGASAQVVQSVIDRLEFTPGARLVCDVLKRMGCRLAIITNSGIHNIAQYVKRELCIDYVVCHDLEVEHGCFTGKFSSAVGDVSFRKDDLLHLMAEREGVHNRNVILVGDFWKNHTASNARRMYETFGPNVFFRANKLPDLTIALYLLGFNGAEVKTLREQKWDDALRDEGRDAGTNRTMFTIQVSSRTREVGQLHRIFEPMDAFKSQIQICNVRQCSLQDGGVCLGVELDMDASVEELVGKELLFAYRKAGFDIHEMGVITKETNWKHHDHNWYIVTLVEQPHIQACNLEAILKKFSDNGVNILYISRLSVETFTAVQFTVVVPDNLHWRTFASELTDLSKRLAVDIACQQDDLERWMRRLVVFDMDSTLIQQEVIDELAKIAGVEAEVKTITDAAMRGEIDFFDSLKQRVALLKGHHGQQLFEQVKKNIVYTPGVERLCSTLKHLGFKMAVISGGFLPVADEVKRHLGLDYAFANTLEVDQAGMLVGRTSGPVVTPTRKRDLLATIANVEGCDVKQTIAVGDGANDIPMLNTAGLGIAFCAKPKVQEVAEFRINQKDLSTVLFLIGVSDHAAERLGTRSC